MIIIIKIKIIIKGYYSKIKIKMKVWIVIICYNC